MHGNGSFLASTGDRYVQHQPLREADAGAITHPDTCSVFLLRSYTGVFHNDRFQNALGHWIAPMAGDTPQTFKQ